MVTTDATGDAGRPYRNNALTRPREVGATREYKDVGGDTAAQVVLNYTRTVGEESKKVRIMLVKENDKWLVYAGTL